MTADIYGSEIFDVPRQKSRCMIMVYSHIMSNPDDKDYQGVVDCTNDVIRCDVGKTIKGGGGASFTLVPRRNYMNFIYPNDYVHIYFDPGDGRGNIRTFFGFVDRIERTISVDSNGASETRFTVSCSDFTKAFNQVNIYFNQHIADRGDFVAKSFGRNIAGTALRTKGISIQGTPADIVMSLTTLILGFGKQFSIPESHPKIGALADHSRKQRLKNVLSGLRDEFQSLIGEAELARRKQEIEEAYQQVVGKEVNKILGAALPLVPGGNVTPQIDLGGLDKIVSKNELALLYDEVNSTRYANAINAQRQAYATGLSLLDMIDFSFVETGAIDGSILAEQIWTSQGPLWTIMNSWSNSIVNELFCDLRLVTANKSWDLAEGPYSKSPDELNKNYGGGVRTVAAMVMREYPFATITGFKPNGVEVQGRELGWIPFSGHSERGALWARDVNIPGRKVNEIKTLNPFRWIESEGKEKGQKHLDVAVISVRDIVNENIGRSDADMSNLFEVYADTGIGATMKYISSTLQPVGNQISIVRHGLRVRTENTRFARWPTNLLPKEQQAGLDSPMARYQCIRWALLLDHWYQHAPEYLNGTITTRAFPEIRVGYRLDIKERNESYYVEGVNHSWQYNEAGGVLTSVFTLTRGQRNDPFPVYVLPALEGWGGITNRDENSRLATYFGQKNPSAVVRSSLLNATASAREATWGGAAAGGALIGLENVADLPSPDKPWAQKAGGRGYIAAGAWNIKNEKDIRAEEKTRAKPTARMNQK